MQLGAIAFFGGTMLAAAAVVGVRANAPAPVVAKSAAEPTVERFVLQASGEERTCTVEKARGSGPTVPVTVAPGCDGLLAGLSRVRYWHEAADGTVDLSIDGRTPVVVFAEADGVAYESIEPRRPLMALLASD
jgi:hypothetical protein